MYCGEEDTTRRHMATGGTATCNRRAVCTHTENGVECGHEYGDYLNHTFANGKCTECGADEFITKLDIEVPYWTVGTPYKALEFPIIKEGRVYCWQTTNYNSYQKSGNGMANVTELTSNIVLVYKFFAQANCKLPANAQDVQITVKNGELVSQSISDSTLVVCVLLRFDDTVQSIDLDFAQPYIENPTADLNITEKNGMKITVDWANVSLQNRFNTNQPYATVTVTAPEGKRFPEFTYSWAEWLCDINITGGELLQWASGTLNDDKTEIRFVVIVSTPLPCPHKESIVKEAGKPETCTENGVKEKYACKSCGKEFADAACIEEWDPTDTVIPAAHKCRHVEAVAVTPADADGNNGKDGNVEYYVCLREECKKIFSDKENANEITLEQTIIHDFDSEYSADNENHYHKCKNCDEKKDGEAHVYGEWKTEVAPTVEDYGVMAHKDCTVCARHFDNDGNEIKDLRIAKIGTHKVIVNGESKFYAHGESVTVTAEDKEGKVFAGWKDESGKIVSTNKSYTFTVTEATTLTAVYEDKAPTPTPQPGTDTKPTTEKQGLSGGAIAGIVIGSVLLAGIGAFAIFWFAVKKKTFADLIAAIKALFTKKK